MHAIIYQGHGKYYISPIFGSYAKSMYSRYYIVWDENKDHLIRWPIYKQKTRYLIARVIVVDSDMISWVDSEKHDIYQGGVIFLPQEEAEAACDAGKLSPELREKCLAYDKGYVYNPYPELKTEKDFEDLRWIAGEFHDARVVKTEMLNDGTLYVFFDGMWGCKLEMWFWGDVEYDTSSRDPKYYDPYWSDSTLLKENGFIYLVDDMEMTADKITSGYCYFEARHAKYHVIPGDKHDD